MQRQVRAADGAGVALKFCWATFAGRGITWNSRQRKEEYWATEPGK